MLRRYISLCYIGNVLDRGLGSVAVDRGDTNMDRSNDINPNLGGHNVNPSNKDFGGASGVNIDKGISDIGGASAVRGDPVIPHSDFSGFSCNFWICLIILICIEFGNAWEYYIAIVSLTI